MPRFFAFDLETTGLDAERDRIMEFCFIEVDSGLGPIGEPYAALVDPQRPIPKKVQEITNITQDMVQGRPAFAHHAPRIQRLLQDTVLIAHNHRFDVPFLHAELVRAGHPGLDANQPCIDTCVIERVVNSHSLEATFQRYMQRAFDGAHRSQADTEATLEVLRAQLRTHAAVLGEDITRLTQRDLARLRDPDAEERVWLDHGHRFYEDGAGKARFAFGKHRDECVHDHEGFLRWMKTREFPADTLVLVDRFLEEIMKPKTAQ